MNTTTITAMAMGVELEPPRPPFFGLFPSVLGDGCVGVVLLMMLLSLVVLLLVLVLLVLLLLLLVSLPLLGVSVGGTVTLVSLLLSADVSLFATGGLVLLLSVTLVLGVVALLLVMGASVVSFTLVSLAVS